MHDGGTATLDLEVVGTDFAAAMARNVRRTIVLCLLMTLLAAAVGYCAGWAAEIVTGLHPALAVLGPEAGVLEQLRATAVSAWGVQSLAAVVGASVAGMVGAVLWADRAVLALNGARPADPEAEAVLHNVVEEMAIAAGAPKPAVHVMETDALNAFATGLRPSRASVTVTRGLLRTLNREELQGVVGHEMAHIVNGDVRFGVMVAVVAGLLALIADGMGRLARLGLRMGTSGGGGESRSSSRKGGGGAVLVLIAVAVWVLVALLAPLAAALVRMAISREREYLADATGAKLTRNPVALASALTKIAEAPHVASASKATEHMFIVSPLRAFGDSAGALFSTHPPTQRRIDRLLNLR
ncbi:M48 family metallopeptidase [Novispirillum sp. DQ9]|uniref:M48 family metallopeptidase n=1 Tax=Novispirillum sp. DQ9 TaxID=3398612 RepID=UPI003C7B8CE4